MRLRIGMWAVVGALVVLCWTFYISAISPTRLGILWPLVCLTCPVAIAHSHALSLVFVVLVNAATYALVGTVIEIVLRHHKNNRPGFISN